MVKPDKSTIITFVHLLIAPLVYYTLVLCGLKHTVPHDHNLLSFDAIFYYSIVEEGYIYVPDLGNSLAFFPLFPLFWQLSNLSPLGVSLINYLMFGFTFSYLIRHFKMSWPLQLIILSFPSLIFFAVPYSEALFFLFSSLILVGYYTKNEASLYLGLFGASLTRSVCLFFIPAILLCALIVPHPEKSLQERLKTTVLEILFSLGGFWAASVYMGVQSGKWFYFFEIQKYWYRKWVLPPFPLTTIYPDRVLGLDGITFVLGLIAIIICMVWAYRSLFNNKTAVINKAVLFSAIFISGMTILDTCFTRITDGSANIWSLNRHVMCTPFMVVLLSYLHNDLKAETYERFALVLVVIAGVFITYLYRYPTFPSLIFYLLFFFTFLSTKFYPSIQRYVVLYYCIALFLQLSFYEDFLRKIWIG